MAGKKLRLQVITPSRVLMDDQVDMVIFRATTGDMGILPNHEPVVATLNYGVLRFKKDKEEQRATIMSGFVKVDEEGVVILTDAAEWPGEIDIERAEQARKRALRRLKDKEGNNIARAQVALQRALVRIDTGRK